jgi:hypothetical protein
VTIREYFDFLRRRYHKTPNGIFFPVFLHGDMDTLWKDKVTPLALAQEMIDKLSIDAGMETDLMEYVWFSVLSKMTGRRLIRY